jgi:hypothetical protein
MDSPTPRPKSSESFHPLVEDFVPRWRRTWLGKLIPKAKSPWWIPVLLLFGWGPLAAADLIYSIYPGSFEREGFGMAWGIVVAFPCTILATISLAVQIIRIGFFFYARPKG